jgi:uncharacterized protein YjiK
MVSKKFIREVRTFEHLFENFQLTDNLTGLTYQSDIDRLLSLPSGSRTAAADITAITITADQDTQHSVRIPSAPLDPLNTTFDNKFDRLLSLQNTNQLIEIKAKANGSLDPTTLTRTNIAQQFGLNNPQGMSVDSTNGTLFVLDQTSRGSQIVRIQPDSNGSFAKATVSRFDLTGVVNPRGIALDPTSGNLQVLSSVQNQLYEVTQTGGIVATRDLSDVVLKNPQALVFAPSGDQTDDPQAVSLYVAEGALGSGGITELTLVPPKVVPTSTSLRAAAATSTSNFVPTLVRTVQTSQFSPASPDPDGIVYINQTNTLLISDSEVEEIPSLFTGKNLFNISLSGTLQSTLTTIGFSNEPAGISYNPSNKNLFFADDDKKKILTLNPGADGQYNTSDDTVTSFLVTPFGGVDAEDVSFSSTTGNLFIIDGTNAEVYQVTTSGSLVSHFDTQIFGIIDPEGIAVGDNGNLFVVGNPGASTNAVGEFTSSGSLVRTIDISAANPKKPAGIAFAPSSLNSAERSLYIVDRGIDNNDVPTENDGRMYEFSLGASTATPGVLSFSAPTFSLNEDGTAVAAVQVTRTSGSAGAVSATVSLTNGTAIAPGDFNNSAIAVNFADGDSATKTVTVPIVNDTLVEGNETVNLSLGSPTNGATIGSQSSAVLTIVDNDVAPTPGILSFSAPTFSLNEDGTAVAAVQVTRTSGSTGAVSATVSLTNGTAIAPGDFNNSAIAVNFADGDAATKTVTIPIVNDTLVEGNETVNLSLGSPTNGATIGSQGSAVLTIVDNDVAPSPAALYVSTSGNGTVGGVPFADEDILAFNQSTNTWSTYFDGSDVGLSSFNVRDFHVNSDGSILFSLNTATTLPGAGSIDGSDIVKFTPTSTGTNTAGAFSLYFDGSDVGLDTSGEKLDAIAIAPDGKIIISTEATPTVPGVSSAADEDLLAFTATSLGDTTVGTWTLYFDGSDVGLTDSVEDVDGVWIDNTGKLFLTTEGAFNVPGATGNGSDVFTFTPTSLGNNTSGTYAPFFNAATAGLTVAIDGVSQTF